MQHILSFLDATPGVAVMSFVLKVVSIVRRRQDPNISIDDVIIAVLDSCDSHDASPNNEQDSLRKIIFAVIGLLIMLYVPSETPIETHPLDFRISAPKIREFPVKISVSNAARYIGRLLRSCGALYLDCTSKSTLAATIGNPSSALYSSRLNFHSLQKVAKLLYEAFPKKSALIGQY